MGQGTEHALWLRGVLIAERERRGWSLEQTARAIGRELGEGGSLTKQSLHAWEGFKVQPRIDQMAAWARALGLRLEVDLVDPRTETVPVQVPVSLASHVREIVALPADDLRMIVDLLARLSRG